MTAGGRCPAFGSGSAGVARVSSARGCRSAMAAPRGESGASGSGGCPRSGGGRASALVHPCRAAEDLGVRASRGRRRRWVCGVVSSGSPGTCSAGSALPVAAPTLRRTARGAARGRTPRCPRAGGGWEGKPGRPGLQCHPCRLPTRMFKACPGDRARRTVLGITDTVTWWRKQG
jgi:hypothetical protein